MFKYGKKKPQGATRNLGRQAQPAAGPRSSLPGWLLVGLGMSIGLFLAFMLYLWKPWQPVKREVGQPAVTAPDTPPAETKSAEPRFDFYRLLPSQKVVPNEPPPEVTPPVTPKPAAKPDTAAKPAADDAKKREADKQRAEAILEGKKVPAPEKPKPDSAAKEKVREPVKEKEADNGKFSLQAGSFKSQAEAERRKAKVALQGLPARVQQVTVKEGQVWYRVIVGPFKGKTASDKAQSELRGGGIDSLMVKEKK
ncbi:MAG TPA: SPOR domain-containing protein [Fluviicoccus sp.]|nr:SPOR domain-containing protein [Fluviicoccus sp.]